MCTVTFLWQICLQYRLEYLRLEILAQRLKPWFRKSLKNVLKFRHVVKCIPGCKQFQGILICFKCFFITVVPSRLKY